MFRWIAQRLSLHRLHIQRQVLQGTHAGHHGVDRLVGQPTQSDRGRDFAHRKRLHHHQPDIVRLGHGDQCLLATGPKCSIGAEDLHTEGVETAYQNMTMIDRG